MPPTTTGNTTRYDGTIVLVLPVVTEKSTTGVAGTIVLLLLYKYYGARFTYNNGSSRSQVRS
jgi:hypothetical protein